MDKKEPYFEAILQSIQDTPQLDRKFRQIETTIDSLLHDDDASVCGNKESHSIIKDTDNGKGSDKFENKEELSPILRLPQDMEDCINIGHNERAMEILHFVTDLKRKYGEKLPLLSETYNKAIQLREQIVQNLTKKLEIIEGSSDPDMFDTIGLLRKCGIFTERDLRLKFLIARDAWFEQNLENRTTDGTFVGMIDTYDQYLPSILHDYAKIFADSDTIVPSQIQKFTSIDHSTDDKSIINSWHLLKLSSFISSLQDYLTFAASNQKSDLICEVFDKCLKMTKKMGTIGYDLEPQLLPLFNEALLVVIRSNIEKATVKFELSFTSSVSISIESLTDQSLSENRIKKSTIWTSTLTEPPASFNDYPIFKNYCYDLLESISLNTDRFTSKHFALFIDVHKALNSSLLRVSKALSTLSKSDYKSNHPILTRLTIYFITELLPYISAQCEVLFPEKSILGLLGLTKLELSTLRSSHSKLIDDFGISTSKIVAPLQMILPKSMSIIGD